MSAFTNAPQRPPRWRRPTYINASMAVPLRTRLPRLWWLRTFAVPEHIIGIALVRKRQRIIQWRTQW